MVSSEWRAFGNRKAFIHPFLVTIIASSFSLLSDSRGDCLPSTLCRNHLSTTFNLHYESKRLFKVIDGKLASTAHYGFITNNDDH